MGWNPCLITYFVTVKFRAQSVTVASSIRSASSGRRTRLKLPTGARAKPARPPGGIASDAKLPTGARAKPARPPGGIASDASAIRLLLMPEPTRDDVDALVGPATPHFAYQLRARVHEL